MSAHDQQIELALTSCHIHSSQHPTRRRRLIGHHATIAAHSAANKHPVKLTNQLTTKTPSTSNMTPTRSIRLRRPLLVCAAVALVLCLATSGCLAADEPAPVKPADSHPTQASVERQVDQPTSASSSTSSSSAGAAKAAAAAPSKPLRSAITSASQKKAAAAAASLASATNYDKYQLKASPSAQSSAVSTGSLSKAQSSSSAKPSDGSTNNKESKEKVKSENNGESSSGSEAQSSIVQPAHKKANVTPKPKSSSFALLKKFLPSFMSSAAAAAAASAAAASTDKHTNPHSRSSAPATSSSALFAHLTGDGPLSYASGKIVSMLSGGAKKRGLIGHEGVSAIPNHAPFFIRKQAADRQAGGGAVALASGLLSNPLKLGLLFSAPLLPSLLLTPLAIAGLSPAMSAINNFFGDDDEPAQSSPSPLAALASGPNSPLASILQATGVSPLPSQASGSQSSSDSSSSSTTGNLALQAFQSLLLGPTSTTERPLFNPGVFGSSSAISNAMSSLGSSVQQASGVSSSGSSSSSSSSNSRPLFGGGLIQTAASMISPSFAAPPSSPGAATGSASSDDDDGRGIMAMASDVFEKVANYMGDGTNKDIGQATGSSPSASANSPLSTLASLSSLSPFQLSSLFAPTAFASALSKPSSGPEKASAGAAAGTTQRAGFFSTLRNVYELFSSSFLRRQEVGDSNECQQRLVCELHQRAMNSKLFRRSLQSNLMELAQLDRNLIEQLKYNSQTIQARVDPDTKAMLSDFLKATNNFKSGRELVNCGQMFPKCSRTQLLAAAHAHLNDPANGRTIGKFGQLMKKMKFKANQQHQSQWKLRKPSFLPSASTLQSKQQPFGMIAEADRKPVDHFQVAPLQQTPAAQTLTPVDSLKLAQQLMVLSQLNQPQAQQQQINALATGQYVPSSVAPPQPQQAQQQQFRAAAASVPQYAEQQQASSLAPSYQSIPSISYSPPAQYSSVPKQTTYTDAVLPAVGQSYVNPTESPYFTNQQQQQPMFQPQVDSMAQYSAQQPQQPNQYQSSYQNYAPNYVSLEQPQQTQSIVNQQQTQQSQQLQPQPQQQQASSIQEGSKQQQQQQTIGQSSKSAIVA